jgi:hypothetical protein
MAAFKMRLLSVWQGDAVEELAEDDGEEGGSDFDDAGERRLRQAAMGVGC